MFYYFTYKLIWFLVKFVFEFFNKKLNKDQFFTNVKKKNLTFECVLSNLIFNYLQLYSITRKTNV